MEEAATVAVEASLSRVQFMVLVAILLSYAGLSYYSDSVPTAVNLAAGLSVGPVVLIGLVLAWRWAHPVVTAVAFVLTGALLYRYWDVIRSSYPWSNLVQQAGAYALVTAGFVRSVMPGGVPVCTQLADRLHGPLTPGEVCYTRQATVAWAVFYLLLTLVIIGLFFLCSQRAWSFFVNFATFVLIGLMFLVEHTIRRRLHPHSRRGNTLTALRQFLVG